MPRGHKGKRHAREQRRQAQGETPPCLQDAQSTAAAEEARGETPPCLQDAESTASAEESTPSSPQSKGIPCPGSDEASPIRDNRAGTSVAPPATESSGPDNLAMVALLLEQFLMHRYKKKQPIVKEDMLKIVGTPYQDKFPHILKKASEHIERMFSLDLKEVDSSNHLYELVCQLKLPNNGRVIPGRGFPKSGLLMTLLGMMFMKGKPATEEEVWRFLSPTRIFPGRKHYIYGEPRKLITKDFVRLQYLEYRQVPDSDPPCYELMWGPKAHTIMSKLKILEYLVKVYNTDPSTFSRCYEEALQKEEIARARDARGAATFAKVSTPSRAMASNIIPPLENSETFYLHIKIRDAYQ